MEKKWKTPKTEDKKTKWGTTQVVITAGTENPEELQEQINQVTNEHPPNSLINTQVFEYKGSLYAKISIKEVRKK